MVIRKVNRQAGKATSAARVPESVRHDKRAQTDKLLKTLFTDVRLGSQRTLHIIDATIAQIPQLVSNDTTIEEVTTQAIGSFVPNQSEAEATSDVVIRDVSTSVLEGSK